MSPKRVEPAWRRKCTIGSATSFEKYSDGNHAQGHLPAASSRETPAKIKGKNKRQK